MKPLIAVCLLGLAFGGCKKGPVASAPVITQPALPPNPQVDLPKLVDGVRAYIMSQGKAPETLDDLVKARCIERLPVPPNGKKYMLDAKKTGVVLVDQ